MKVVLLEEIEDGDEFLFGYVSEGRGSAGGVEVKDDGGLKCGEAVVKVIEGGREGWGDVVVEGLCNDVGNGKILNLAEVIFVVDVRMMFLDFIKGFEAVGGSAGFAPLEVGDGFDVCGGEDVVKEGSD